MLSLPPHQAPRKFSRQLRLLQWLKRSGWLTIAALALSLVTIVLIMPARATQVQVTPANPQLGDTLSLIVQVPDGGNQAAPTIRFGQKNYPSFAIAPNRYRALLPTTPLDKPGTLTLQVDAAGETAQASVKLRDRTFPTQSIWLPPGKDGDISDAEYNRVNAFKQQTTPQKLWNGPFLKPNDGPVTGVYGIRRYYNGVFANDYYHRGVDYAGGYGSAVIAPAAGRVALVGRESNGFAVNGNIIGLDHGQGVTSAYLHLSRILVKEGDLVKPGQVIGAVGDTGAATGPHLHWGLYVNGLSVDPVPWRNKGFN